jgi:exonuclease VII large subunit
MEDQKTQVKTYPLTQLNQSFTNWVRDAFGSRTYWISCEVAKANLKGVHWYLELVDSNHIDETTAKSSASIWRSNTVRIAEDLKAYGLRPEERKQGSN